MIVDVLWVVDTAFATVGVAVSVRVLLRALSLRKAVKGLSSYASADIAAVNARFHAPTPEELS